MDTVESGDRLRDFVNLISGCLDEDIDGKGIAARGCLSRYHFDRLVSAAVGETPIAFRRRLLLERAAWEIGSAHHSITWTALRSGFQSPEGFSRAFRSAYGASPREFRETRRQANGSYGPGALGFQLPAPNGVHFRPPSGLTVPGNNQRSTRMDIVDRLTGHDIWLTNRLIEAASGLPDDTLDRPVLQGMPLLFGEHPITLREILGSMVSNKERWSMAIKGSSAEPSDDDTLTGLKDRMRTFGPEFQRQVKAVDEKGAWDDGFVDAQCEPPVSFTYGGMLAHVITFSTYRRTLAILALRELGVTGLGIGDPVEWERQAA